MVEEEKDRRVTSRPRSRDSKPPPRLQIADLLQGGQEAIIEHRGEDYRLRITASGKLILTK